MDIYGVNEEKSFWKGDPKNAGKEKQEFVKKLLTTSDVLDDLETFLDKIELDFFGKRWPSVDKQSQYNFDEDIKYFSKSAKDGISGLITVIKNAALKYKN